MKKSHLKQSIMKYNNGLELKISSLNWIHEMKDTNQSLYVDFAASYLEFIEIALADSSVNEDSNDIFIQGCHTIEDHIIHMMKNPYEYCRNIDLAIISTFLDINIHVYTDNNEDLNILTTVVPKNTDEGPNSTRPFVTIHFKNAHYSPIMKKDRKKADKVDHQNCPSYDGDFTISHVTRKINEGNINESKGYLSVE